MSNRESDRAQEMVDRIEEALAWEPGDPIHEQEYNSDWTGADNHMARMRCAECQVDWPEPEEPCWSCGQPKPLLDPWWKRAVGDDRNTDERPPVQHFYLHSIHQVGPAFDVETVLRRREAMAVSLGFQAASFRDAADRAAEHMRGFRTRMVVIDEASNLRNDALFALFNSYRNLSIASSRRYARASFLQNLWTLWTPEVPNEGTVVQTVTRDRVEQIPRTPKVFDFDLGLPKTTPTRLGANPEQFDEWSIEVPRHIPEKQVPLPHRELGELVEIPLELRLPDEERNPLSRSITSVRRSRHI